MQQIWRQKSAAFPGGGQDWLSHIPQGPGKSQSHMQVGGSCPGQQNKQRTKDEAEGHSVPGLPGSRAGCKSGGTGPTSGMLFSDAVWHLCYSRASQSSSRDVAQGWVEGGHSDPGEPACLLAFTSFGCIIILVEISCPVLSVCQAVFYIKLPCPPSQNLKVRVKMPSQAVWPGL